MNLEKFGEYLLIKDKDLVGIYILVFTKVHLKERIKKVISYEVKTGLMGG